MKIRVGELRIRVWSIVAAIAPGALLLVIASVKPAPAEPLRVGVYQGVHCALIYVADAQGLFKKQGIDLAIKEYESGVSAVDDFLADKVDIATASDYTFVVQSLKHRDVRMPATICMASDEELVVRKDRGIARPEDLMGRRVAVLRGGQTEFFLYNYFIFNRIPAEKVEIVDHRPPQMSKAMADGTIDAALCWPPYTTEMARQLGSRGDLWPAQSGQAYYQVLFAKAGFLKREPKTMERFLASLSEAEDYIARYPEQARAILRQRLKLKAEPSSAMWSLYRFQLQFTQDLVVLMEREAKFAIRSSQLENTEIPNYLEFFHFGALDKVKPEAVSIVH